MLTNHFKNQKVFTPVIHLSDNDQAIRNSVIAAEAEADGVFLISHQGSVEDTLSAVQAVKQELPDLWIGVNFLGVQPHSAWSLLDENISGLWADNAGIDERKDAQPYAEATLRARELSGWEGLYFGGVAFKYQRPVADLETAAKLAKDFMEVPTTSGSGTGHAAEVEKVRRLKSALGEHPLGIASGISADNVESFLPYVDVFLVATGISDDFVNLNPELTKRVSEIIHS